MQDFFRIWQAVKRENNASKSKLSEKIYQARLESEVYMARWKATQETIDTCIEKDILKDFLIDNREMIEDLLDAQQDIEVLLDYEKQLEQELGPEKGKEKMAQIMLDQGASNEEISLITGQSAETIEAIRADRCSEKNSE